MAAPEQDKIPIIVTEPVYLGEHEEIRGPTMLESGVQDLLVSKHGAVKTAVDPATGQYVETLSGLRNGRDLANGDYKIERRTNPEGHLSEIVVYGLNGRHLSRGAIHSDSHGETRQTVRINDPIRYPRIKLPILAVRLKRLAEK